MEHRASSATTEDLLARLEALQARLDDQAAEIARLKAEAIAPAPTHPTGAVFEPRVGRRGMLAKVLGATAAAAVLTVAKEAASAEAATRTTVLTGAGSTASYGLVVSDGAALDPLNFLPNLGGRYFGLIGTIASSTIPAPVSAGVFGSSNSNSGVLGLTSGGTGVWGQSSSGVGTIGISTSATGMYGFSANGVGVYGSSQASAGLYGQASNSAGVLGDSPVYGVWGRTSTGLGVRGEATGAGIAVYGTAAPGGFAGYFNGPVFIRGYGVLGSGAGPQASATRASTLEVEDVGEAQLVNGQATVALDPEIAALTGGAQYHVFLTEIDDHNALFVTKKGPKGFEVRAKASPTANARFSYRVVAQSKRVTGPATERRAEPAVAIPKDVPVPAPPRLPEPGRSGER